ASGVSGIGGHGRSSSASIAGGGGGAGIARGSGAAGPVPVVAHPVAAIATSNACRQLAKQRVQLLAVPDEPAAVLVLEPMPCICDVSLPLRGLPVLRGSVQAGLLDVAGGLAQVREFRILRLQLH